MTNNYREPIGDGEYMPQQSPKPWPAWLDAHQPMSDLEAAVHRSVTGFWDTHSGTADREHEAETAGS